MTGVTKKWWPIIQTYINPQMYNQPTYTSQLVYESEKEDHHQDFNGTLLLFALLLNLIIFPASEVDSSDKIHSIICQGW